MFVQITVSYIAIDVSDLVKNQISNVRISAITRQKIYIIEFFMSKRYFEKLKENNFKLFSKFYQ